MRLRYLLFAFKKLRMRMLREKFINNGFLFLNLFSVLTFMLSITSLIIPVPFLIIRTIGIMCLCILSWLVYSLLTIPSYKKVIKTADRLCLGERFLFAYENSNSYEPINQSMFMEAVQIAHNSNFEKVYKPKIKKNFFFLIIIFLSILIYFIPSAPKEKAKQLEHINGLSFINTIE